MVDENNSESSSLQRVMEKLNEGINRQNPIEGVSSIHHALTLGPTEISSLVSKKLQPKENRTDRRHGSKIQPVDEVSKNISLTSIYNPVSLEEEINPENSTLDISPEVKARLQEVLLRVLYGNEYVIDPEKLNIREYRPGEYNSLLGRSQSENVITDSVREPEQEEAKIKSGSFNNEDHHPKKEYSSARKLSAATLLTLASVFGPNAARIFAAGIPNPTTENSPTTALVSKLESNNSLNFNIGATEIIGGTTRQADSLLNSPPEIPPAEGPAVEPFIGQPKADFDALGQTEQSKKGELFEITGFTVSGPFLDKWNNFGGLAQMGYPITNMFLEKSATDGKTYAVQYFERAVFEYHPENNQANEVLLSLLGSQAKKEDEKNGELSFAKPPTAQQKADFDALGATDTEKKGILFPETNHTLSGIFANYWETHGGLAQQGYPISDLIVKKSSDGNPYITQYFERSVFEYHPENTDPAYQVLLALLGTGKLGELYTVDPATGELHLNDLTGGSTGGQYTPTPEVPTATPTPEGLSYHNPLEELPQFNGFRLKFAYNGSGNGKIATITDSRKFALAIFKGADFPQKNDLLSTLKNTNTRIIPNYTYYKTVGIYKDETGVIRSLLAPFTANLDVGQEMVIERNDSLVEGNTIYDYYGGARYSQGIVNGQYQIHFSSDFGIVNPQNFEEIILTILNFNAHLSDSNYTFPDSPQNPYMQYVYNEERNGNWPVTLNDISGIFGSQ